MTTDDIGLVEYDDPVHGWLPVDRDSYLVVAAGVDQTEVPDSVRARTRFTLNQGQEDERKACWSGQQFEVLPVRPLILVMTDDMMRGQ